MSAAAGGASATDASVLIGMIIWFTILIGCFWGLFISCLKAIKTETNSCSNPPVQAEAEPLDAGSVEHSEIDNVDSVNQKLKKYLK